MNSWKGCRGPLWDSSWVFPLGLGFWPCWTARLTRATTMSDLLEHLQREFGRIFPPITKPVDPTEQTDTEEKE
ncbi:hypothetical protein GCM10009090_17730 [[Pseudomonas] boreopolis]|uniref:Uncharacterized protein n=1 Tax=Xanthomonas boreopolis TaxID=86183 RepID=A0A919F7U3_9XANT|nr:hypothetical protein GCM10009090_17730 [[Pseudomonas] boreopolis]